MARRNKKHQSHENHERWLITYADLITLLLIFFVIMYAMSKVDMKKYDILSQTLHLQFAKADSVMQKYDGINGSTKTGKGEKGSSTDLQSIFSPTPTATPSPSPSESAKDKDQREKELEDLLSKVNQYIHENGLEAQVSAYNSQRGVVIKLNDLVLFDLGKADLKPASLPILDKLASLFETLNTKVSIDGHTDDLPLQTGSLYKDNWGLSQARSVSVVRHFLSIPDMRNDMFVSAAYADTEPVAPNDSEENRAKNRRVEIVVLRDPIRK